jgi:RING finger protein 113A
MSDLATDRTAPEAAAPAAAVPTVPSKRKHRGNLRKRPAVDSDDDSAMPVTLAPDVARKAQRVRESAPLAFTTKREGRADIFKFESSGGLQVRDDGGATRALDINTADDRDNRAIKERALAAQQEATAGEGGGDQVYRGMSGYRDYRAGFRREQSVSQQKASGSHGPLRAPTNIRSSIRVDYQPDVCKDYKETGYCGFGDACKFLHDRGDYKAGWELDSEWEAKQKEQREKLLQGLEGGSGGEAGSDDADDDDDDDDEVPFACFICRRPWGECQDPVVTRCRHHFCEQCALQHNAKSAKCFVCEQPTGGIFNVANDVIKREKERKRKEGA